MTVEEIEQLRLLRKLGGMREAFEDVFLSRRVDNLFGRVLIMAILTGCEEVLSFVYSFSMSDWDRLKLFLLTNKGYCKVVNDARRAN